MGSRPLLCLIVIGLEFAAQRDADRTGFQNERRPRSSSQCCIKGNTARWFVKDVLGPQFDANAIVCRADPRTHVHFDITVLDVERQLCGCPYTSR